MSERGLLLAAAVSAIASLSVLAACAPKAVVVVSPAYPAAHVKAVAVTSFSDYPGAAGSGDVAANTFEKYLLQAGYRVVDSSQADALAVGAVTGYQGARDETVMVDVPQSQSDPIYGQVVTTQRSGDTRVRTVQNVVTGYAVTQTSQIVPETQTVPASVALNVRLLDARTNELLWSVSSSGTGDDPAAATEEASAAAMKALHKKIK